MLLNRIKLTQFKNCQETDLSLSENINCFIGNNGAGKTNILDAIYYLSFCKSYFNNNDTSSIKHDEDFFAIHGWYKNPDDAIVDQISCTLKKGTKKKFKRNDEEYQRLADHIGSYPLVMVSPYDRDLINEGSDARRRYIDSVISQFNKSYLNDLINYNKALQQRNSLIKQFAERGFWDHTLMEMWDNSIIPLGERINKERAVFLEEFIPLFKEYFEFISEGKEEVSIAYQSQLNYNEFEQLLKDAVDKDRQLRYSSVGIHKDDMEFLIMGYPVKKFGSQGQQKSFVIALKLAQFEYTRRKKGFKPVLLFDDIFDKLDDLRVGQLISLVGDDNFGQVFITDTQQERIGKLLRNTEIDHKIFRVDKGMIEEIEDKHII
jgi:DNA replication and repair protein RecF